MSCGLTSSDPRPWGPSARRSGVRFLTWRGRRRTCCLAVEKERERHSRWTTCVCVNTKASREALTDLWPPSAPAQCWAWWWGWRCVWCPPCLPGFCCDTWGWDARPVSAAGPGCPPGAACKVLMGDGHLGSIRSFHQENQDDEDAEDKPIVFSLFIFQDSGPSCTIVLLVRSKFWLAERFHTCEHI